MNLSFGHMTNLESYEQLLDAIPDREFERATRSTVPLLAFWKDATKVEALGRLLDVPDLAAGDASFEFAVSPRCDRCKGRGKSSFTDVLVRSGDHVVAIEAKHTENVYRTVSEWLGTTPPPNKRKVLEHWLSCCIGSAATLERVGDLVYQMIHRTASACYAAGAAATPHVVHLLFGSEHVNAYIAAVARLAGVVSPDRRIKFAVVFVPTRPTDELNRLANDPEVLREALGGTVDLFEFGAPEERYASWEAP